MAVRTIDVRERVMARNDLLAAEVRCRLEHAGVLAFNLVSSPGSGKTLLLERTLEALGEELDIAVVTGDVQTQNDADRLSAAGITSRSITTGSACHLDAGMVHYGLHHLPWREMDYLFIENVGNLVCPAGWDLGEMAKIVVFSVTEGEDKPLKYPKMFRMASYAVLNKIDLLPHLEFDAELAIANALEVNPALRFFRTSARTGEGLPEWFDFLKSSVGQVAGW